jgi:proteasome lid subunit RPN8/RPN11
VTPAQEALRLKPDALATVVAWQRAAGFEEVCGLAAIDELCRQRVIRLTNHSGLADAFEVSRSEEEVMRVAAAQRGWEIVAFLHTHPRHGPEMSVRDASSFARDTLPWIIIGTPVTSPDQRAYARPITAW